MACAPVCELHERLCEVMRQVQPGEEFVVARNGKAVAMLVGIEPSEVETAPKADRVARFGVALARIQAQAHPTGAATLTDEDIQAEIDVMRKGRRQLARAAAR
jgi:antitoxin (DNA-binding transcriptional repressor) of toxin-antitoxin stability system